MTDLDNYTLYIQDMRRYPVLTKAEEKELIQKMKAGDKEARDRLVNCNQRLVISIARAYFGKGIEPMELIQQGNIGLMYALDRFDPNKSGALSTYATYGIKKAIRSYFYNQSRLIRIPQWKQEVTSALNKARAHLKETLGREPTNEELSNETGILLETIINIENGNEPVPISFETPLNENGDTIEDLIPAPEDTLLTRNKHKKAIEKALSFLPPEDALFLEELYGLHGKPGKTLAQMGEIKGVSHQSIVNQRSKILRKLRYPEILQQIRKEL